jgi:hypothetical protein
MHRIRDLTSTSGLELSASTSSSDASTPTADASTTSARAPPSRHDHNFFPINQRNNLLAVTPPETPHPPNNPPAGSFFSACDAHCTKHERAAFVRVFTKT